LIFSGFKDIFEYGTCLSSKGSILGINGIYSIHLFKRHNELIGLGLSTTDKVGKSTMHHDFLLVFVAPFHNGGNVLGGLGKANASALKGFVGFPNV
jgi:hypothetical protein